MKSYVIYEECPSCCRYTYGQPVRGTADVAVSIQPYSMYDRGEYGSKLINVQVSMTANSATSCAASCYRQDCLQGEMPVLLILFTILQLNLTERNLQNVTERWVIYACASTVSLVINLQNRQTIQAQILFLFLFLFQILFWV